MPNSSLPFSPAADRSPGSPKEYHRADRKVVLDTAKEIEILKDAIHEFGAPNADGNSSVAYGVLFDKTANTLEALNGTLRSAKRQKKVTFDAELLMMPKDKDVQVVWVGA